MDPIDQDEAAQAFAQAGVSDPQGEATPHSMAAAGKCFRVQTNHGQIVMSVGLESGTLWCYGAAGTGERMYLVADAVMTRIGRLSGISRIGFQTKRRGLVRRACALGYQITGTRGSGFALEKTIT